jgi:hypothetical protein
MSTRDLPEGRGEARPERKDDSLTATCEPIVSKPSRPAYYRDSFILHIFYKLLVFL